MWQSSGASCYQPPHTLPNHFFWFVCIRILDVSSGCLARRIGQSKRLNFYVWTKTAVKYEIHCLSTYFTKKSTRDFFRNFETSWNFPWIRPLGPWIVQIQKVVLLQRNYWMSSKVSWSWSFMVDVLIGMALFPHFRMELSLNIENTLHGREKTSIESSDQYPPWMTTSHQFTSIFKWETASWQVQTKFQRTLPHCWCCRNPSWTCYEYNLVDLFPGITPCGWSDFWTHQQYHWKNLLEKTHFHTFSMVETTADPQELLETSLTSCWFGNLEPLIQVRSTSRSTKNSTQG